MARIITDAPYNSNAMLGHELIREYYACFNERRFADGAELFADDAQIEHVPIGQRLQGGSGYIQFAEMWVAAFPDAALSIVRVEQHGDTICEVDLLGTGTHLGPFDLGPAGLFKATGARARLPFRELLEIRVGKITYSSMRFDLHELVRQLRPDDPAE
jgi:predicted ester cyclase